MVLLPLLVAVEFDVDVAPFVVVVAPLLALARSLSDLCVVKRFDDDDDDDDDDDNINKRDIL